MEEQMVWFKPSEISRGEIDKIFSAFHYKQADVDKIFKENPGLSDKVKLILYDKYNEVQDLPPLQANIEYDCIIIKVYKNDPYEDRLPPELKALNEELDAEMNGVDYILGSLLIFVILAVIIAIVMVITKLILK